MKIDLNITSNPKKVNSVRFSFGLSANLVEIDSHEEEHERDDDEPVDLEAVGEDVGADDGAEYVCQRVGVLLDDVVQMLQDGSDDHAPNRVRQERKEKQ